MDHFALLDEPRRPWLDEQALKTKFLALSSQFHPDRHHNHSQPEKNLAHERFTALNAAYNCLRQPKERLRHLLELESGARPADVRQIPPEIMSWFVQIGHDLGEASRFLRERAGSDSPLLKARFFQQGLLLSEKLQTLAKELQARQTRLFEELKTMNASWEAAPPAGLPGRAAALPLARLDEIYRLLSFLGRWSSQLQERALAISFA
jgi:DnaJ-domain-containing protein 1